jgi:hypothetical protein
LIMLRSSFVIQGRNRPSEKCIPLKKMMMTSI